ncbi:MAG TPA: TlpA disulfide reductase family protein [Steroidobacteraceae bacterium]|nr:TlpA disulfide reductase family protein [Steroidobacteraceae bacterium]
MSLRPAFALLLTLLLTSCSRDTTPTAAPWAGSYRAVLTLPGGELPFGLELAEESGRPLATLVNGAERIRVPEVLVQGSQFTLSMPGFNNQIVARYADGTLEGTLTMVKTGGRNQAIPLKATRGKDYRFFADALPAGGDVAGRWATTFTDDEGTSYIAVGEFQQRGHIVTGTFLTGTGDHRYLAGELREGQLFLSSFNGGQVYLYHATLAADGGLAGDYWSGLRSHERFVARRDETATLGDTTSVTAMRDPQARFDFTFPDVTGQAVSLSDERFRGKVVVVTLAGSWCPNCHDEAAFLAPYYREHRDEGLAVFGLMFEQFDDLANASKAVRRFQLKYDIGFPLLIAGVTSDDDPEKKLPQLNSVYAYPTTIFIDRKGKVRRIHTGFSGPATGIHYTELTREFDQVIRELLAEKG